MGGDYAGLTGPQLLKLVFRLPAYTGVMQLISRIDYFNAHPELQETGQRPAQAIPPGPTNQAVAGQQPDRVIDLTPDMLKSGQFAGLIEFGGG